MGTLYNYIPDLAVINYVASTSLQELNDLLGAAQCGVVNLHGEMVRDKASLLAATSRQLFDGLDSHNWSALEDLLRNTVWKLDKKFVALVWTDAHQMLNGGLSDLITAVDIFTGLSRNLYKQDRVFVTFLVGDGPNFPPLESKLAV